ncbi:DUF1330 domain-containing protein [Mameliella alba]|uniref:DUF1330 domain-containing protein n=1 Tax=Mameliella alba TaxID=561184 RepID=A0A0B3SX39_9RHOB|nr:DUF1330 domain-containing protein [Mameliella alba]KHQ54979.1 hypothetical protein OA50_00013 [Mameliella alba]
MSVYVIACLTPDPEQMDAYQTYMATALPLLEKVGGKLSQHFPVGDVVVGEKPTEAIMVVEYPDIAAVHALFDSDEYQQLIPVRDRAFSTYSVSIVS